jgi:signal transduction histidine kinase
VESVTGTSFLQRNFWKGQLGLTLATIVAYALARNTAFGPSIFNLASLSACVAFAVGPIIHRCKAIQWWLFSAAMGLFAIADGTWNAYVFAGTEAPYPSVGDVFYLVAYPLFFLGAVVLLRGSRPRRGDVLDGLLVATAAGVLVWTLLVEPIAAQSGSTLLERLVTLAYPTMDVLLLTALVALLFTSRVRSFAYLALLGGFLLLLAADLIYAVVVLTEQYAAGDWIDYGWIVAYGAMAIAVLHPSLPQLNQQAPERRGALGRGRLAVIGAALAVGPLLALSYDIAGHTGVALEIPAASLLAVGIVLARVSYLWRERQSAEVALREREASYRNLYGVAETARERVTAQNEELLQLDRMKDEFVALISHELRTPLTSIGGYVELLREDLEDATIEQQDKFLSVVERNSARLLSLVNDLLLMAQIELGKLDLTRAAMELVPLAEECVAAAMPVAEERQIEVTVNALARPVLTADRARLAQVVDNLLSNALKFTPPGGKVELRVGSGEGTASLEVRDSGIGINRDDQKQLFSSFFRSAAANAAAVPGTGLGLAISKSIVEGHGGTISMESEEGHGSTFRIELPLGGAVASELPAPALVA